MSLRYGCICYAVPKKMLVHLASQSDGEEKQALLDQVHHSTHLRGRRAAASSGRVSLGKPGEKVLHRQVFDAQGRTFLPGKLLRDEDDPSTADKIADQAYENVGIALRFFDTVLGRDSVDGKGMRIDATVHYGFGFSNAMWTGEQMIVGDGDGRHVSNLAGSLGIIAHELSHGVSQHLVRGGLGVVQMAGQPPALKGEAGALNESFSDVCASMIKQWHAGQGVDSADWLLGEDILAAHAGKAIRSLKDPGNTRATWAQDDQISDYRRFAPTDDPHKGSGIGNHAFYLAAMELGGKSWETLGAVWFKGFDKLRSRSTFLDAAHATVDVAGDLHGKNSVAHRAVKAAWRQVNVLN
ncbi:MAG: M4 family metallopeptidase [Ramlibacter sp.]|nr:M4 family metallopeptidase [Ramlibacter sp.]MCW5650150.1 M4 family metallopeptidase [Ramlibacter sp.]